MPSDCNRIRRVSRRDGAFSALRKTFLTDLDGREHSDQSKSAETQKDGFQGSHLFESVCA